MSGWYLRLGYESMLLNTCLGALSFSRKAPINIQHNRSYDSSSVCIYQRLLLDGRWVLFDAGNSHENLSIKSSFG
jgi:hypothetical protein